MKRNIFIIGTLAISLTAAMICAVAIAHAAETPPATEPCTPTPCVTLNANQLAAIAPLIQQQRDNAANAYKATQAVIDSIQAQIDKQAADEKKKK